MNRWLAILALAGMASVWPCASSASDPAWDQATLSVPEAQGSQATPSQKPGNAGSEVMETCGDPDELGGGFRNNIKPPTESGQLAGAGSTQTGALGALLQLVLRLL